MTHIRLIWLSAVACLAFLHPAAAHPHVWITMRTGILFDGMDHADPFANGWFVFNGGGGGSISASTQLPPQDGCGASLSVGYGGPNGYIGGFGRTFPIDLSGKTDFQFWINPDANQRYTLEINLQDDDNGDNGDNAGGKFSSLCVSARQAPTPYLLGQARLKSL